MSLFYDLILVWVSRYFLIRISQVNSQDQRHCQVAPKLNFLLILINSEFCRDYHTKFLCCSSQFVHFLHLFDWCFLFLLRWPSGAAVIAGLIVASSFFELASSVSFLSVGFLLVGNCANMSLKYFILSLSVFNFQFLNPAGMLALLSF